MTYMSTDIKEVSCTEGLVRVTLTSAASRRPGDGITPPNVLTLELSATAAGVLADRLAAALRDALAAS